MGHVLNETIQDILVRHARMEGKNACWVRGTDHASIATEAKVVNRLAEQGIKKTDLTREEFLKYAWEWKEEHGGIILKQLRRLGASCDWDRTAFTMDPIRSESVMKVFCDLYDKGLIYRGLRMVNWDPKAQTALSNIEVIYKEENSKLYYLKYYVVDQDAVRPSGEEGEVLVSNVRRIGLRTVDLDCSDIREGTDSGKFLFRINYTPIYVRGVNWVPLDPIPSRQAGLLKDVLPMMSDLNANMVRIWGGGVYEPDAFYDWCDENGVMVWQDFMMACTVPPQDDGFAAKMAEEVRFQVLRLRDHASLVLWAGDNENDQAGSWTLAPRHRDPNTNRITREVIPNVLKEFDVTRPYLPSSPFVSRDAFAGRSKPSEDHLWGGERGWWKTDYYVKTPYWFCSEGGSHAVPCRKSMERMMGLEEAARPWTNPDAATWRDLEWNDPWHLHATCPFLDRKIDPFFRNNHVTRQCAALWGEVPRHDLDLFIAQSQTAQAESIKFQVELFRSEKIERRGGYIVWNLRDGWPTLSDAICDYYGERKKSYFALKRAFQDVLVMVTEDGALRVLNDTLKPVGGHVKVVEAKDGRMIFEGPFEVESNGSNTLTRLHWDGQGLYRIEWTSDAGNGKNHYLHGEPPFAWNDYCRWTDQ